MNFKHETNENCITLPIDGDLVSTTTESLRTVADGVLGDSSPIPMRWNVLRLDLTRTAMVDSAGLNLIVSLLKRVQARGAKMQIAYSSPNLMRTFIFTRLDQHVELIKV